MLPMEFEDGDKISVGGGGGGICSLPLSLLKTAMCMHIALKNCMSNLKLNIHTCTYNLPTSGFKVQNDTANT